MRKKRFLSIVIVLLLVMSLVIGLVACNPNLEDPEYDDKGDLITNGNFTGTSTTTDYPKSPSSWSGEAGSTSSDNATDVDSDALVSGIINTKDDYYKAYRRKWGNLANPGKVGVDDDNILMIYNKKSTAYGYRSGSTSLKPNKFYKLSVSVRTDNITGSGARIVVTGDVYNMFNVGSTNGQWREYTMFIETSKSSSTSIKVGLFNGYKGKNDGELSKGYAFFDNVTVEEVEKKDYESADTAQATVSKKSALYGDSDMTNVSGVNNIYSPASYNNAYSTGTNGSAPTGSDYLEKGIIDANDNPPTSLPGNYDNGLSPDSDKSFLFINNKELTAFGYRSNTKLRFESGEYYKLEIRLATFIDAVTSADTGANIRLMTGTSKDDTVAVIENINTKDEWATATFYIKADKIRNKDLYIQFDLGSGGAKDNHTLVKGKLLVDYYRVLPSNEDEYNSKTVSGGLTSMEAAYNLDTWSYSEDDNILAGVNSGLDNWAEDKIAYEGYSSTGGTGAYKGKLGHANTGNWDTALGLGENPGSYDGANPNSDVIALYNAQLAVNYRALYKNPDDLKNNDGYYKIAANNYYRIGMWVKTKDIKDSAGLTVSLMAYDNSSKSETVTESSKHSTLQSITNFNSENLDDSSEYTELVFYVEGDLLKDKYIYLSFALGSGSFLEPANHVKGAAYISGITMFSVPFSDYSSETGDYVKKHSFKSDSQSISNGNFDNINNQTTFNYYDTGEDGYKLEYTNGYLDNEFGVPNGWTASNEDANKTQLNAGVFNLNSAELQNRLNEEKNSVINFDDSFYKGFESVYGNTMNKSTNPNVLVIDTKPAGDGYKFTTATPIEACGCENQACKDQGYCDGKATGCATQTKKCKHQEYNGNVAPFGYKSSSISLSANSYYMISVWAKASRGEGSIRLTTSSKDNEQLIKVVNDEWTRYDFYIQTGFDSTTAYIELYLGEAGSSNEINGTVFFDLPQLTTIDENTYNLAEKEYEGNPAPTALVLSYTVNSMDNYTSNEGALGTPTGWTGAQEDSDSPNEERDIVSGIYNIKDGNREWFGKNEDDPDIISFSDMQKILDDNNQNALVINNNVATEYNYTYSLSKSLSTDSYYKISIRVLTYNLSDDAFATLTLKLNNLSYSFGYNADKNVNVDHNLEWHEYSFYINTPKSTTISNTSMKVALGTKNKLVKGYAFFDDLTIEKIDKDEFDEAVPVEGEGENEKPAAGYNTADEMRIVFTEEDANADEPEDDDSDPLLWLYISSGILGGLVVIVFLFYIGRWLYNNKIRPYMIKRKKATAKANRTGDRNKNSAYTPTTKKDNDKYKD